MDAERCLMLWNPKSCTPALGTEISRKEASGILKSSADAGLVHGISGHKDSPDSICNCCSCCCIFLQSANVLGLHGHQRSNYVSSLKADTCKGCGTCEVYCPMNAVHLSVSLEANNKKGKVPSIEVEKCIGCGVCAYKCPTGSLVLVERMCEEDLPANDRDMAQQMAKERGLVIPGL
jgi:NAD-dependent dihydropyrimidine dehydrogenase PreA subunit